jgi:predicted small metal-binding protein
MDATSILDILEDIKDDVKNKHNTSALNTIERLVNAIKSDVC